MFRIATIQLRLVTIVSAGFSGRRGLLPRRAEVLHVNGVVMMGKPKSRVCNAIVPGPLEQYAPGFRSWLLEQGYTPLTTVPQLQLMAHVSRWLEREGLTARPDRAAGGPVPGRASRCRESAAEEVGGPAPAAGLPGRARGHPAGTAGTAAGRGVRADRGVRGVPPLRAGPGADDRRGVSSRAARFLARYALDGDAGLIASADVTAAVLAEASGLSASAGQHLACALRAFLRYCHVRGLVTADVSAAALAVTGRRTTMLPRGLEPGTMTALLAACDRAEPDGRRDYEVILLLARLGLRAGEAARLRLDDVNWRAGEIGIRGKGGRVRRPPAPGRRRRRDRRLAARRPPGRLLREVFTTVTAPTRPLTREAAANIVRRACARAGMPSAWRAPAAPLRGLRHDRREGPDGGDRAGHAAPLPWRDRDLRSRRDRPAASPRPSLARNAGPAGRGSVMTTLLHERAEEYLRLRRALGFRLRHEGYILPQFADYLEQHGAATVTAEHAIAWAQLRPGRPPGDLDPPAVRRPRVCGLAADRRPRDGDPAQGRVPRAGQAARPVHLHQ